MPQDFTQTMRDIDALQERIDKTFKRVNADPIFSSPSAIRDAISDNARYYPVDRKNELAEIFFAILDQIYEKLVRQDSQDPFCNPQIPYAPGVTRFPEFEMLARDMMPLGWAIEAKWADSSLADAYDMYLGTYSEEESSVIYDALIFCLDLFPECRDSRIGGDLAEYWRRFSLERGSMREENDRDKAFLLSVLMRKKAQIDAAAKS